MEHGIIACLIGLFLAGCASPGERSVSEPVMPRPDSCANESWYDSRVDEYASREGMTQEWAEFVKSEYEHNCLAQAVTEFYHNRGTPVKFAVRYWHDQQAEGWKDNEDVHMALLTELMELVFPTIEFEFTMGGDPLENDAIISLNDPGNSWGNSTYIAIAPGKEGILVHEVGHFFGINHHYDTLADTGDHGHMAPPGNEKCIQDRTSQEYDTVCRFALGLPAYESNAEEISSLVYAVTGK